MTSDNSPHCARMIEDMTERGFSKQTRNNHVGNVRAFAACIRRSSDTATTEDLRLFQLHQMLNLAHNRVRGGRNHHLIGAMRV